MQIGQTCNQGYSVEVKKIGMEVEPKVNSKEALMYSKVEDKSQGKSKGCFVFQGQGLGLWVSRLGFRALGFRPRV